MITIWQCPEPGRIVKTDVSELSYMVFSSQFCIVKKYRVLHEEARKRLEATENPPYALPAAGKTAREYRGIDRDPLSFTPDDFHEYPEQRAIAYFASLPEKEDLDLLFVRVSGHSDRIPEGFTLLGYDATYPVGEYSDGFSVIGDCMFLGRWHGCDPAGTEFEAEFHALNQNGLFDTAEETYRYMIHYLNQPWSECGDFCIYEVYGSHS